jgi:hypothetical protein
VGLLLQRVYDEEAPTHDFRKEIRTHLHRHGLSSYNRGCAALPGHPVHLGGPVQELQRLDWFRAVHALNGEGPNFRGKYKSAYMRKPFPREQAQAIYASLTQDVEANGRAVDLSQSLVQVDTYGGRVNYVPSHATAVPQRSSVLHHGLTKGTLTVPMAQTQNTLRFPLGRVGRRVLAEADGVAALPHVAREIRVVEA